MAKTGVKNGSFYVVRHRCVRTHIENQGLIYISKQNGVFFNFFEDTSQIEQYHSLDADRRASAPTPSAWRFHAKRLEISRQVLGVLFPNTGSCRELFRSMALA